MSSLSKANSVSDSMLYHWLMPEWNYSPWVFMAALMACYAVSVHVRYQQFVTFKKYPETYFVGERPMMTTADATYWLRLARKYNEGTYGSDELRAYPSGSKEFNDRQKKKNSPLRNTGLWISKNRFRQSVRSVTGKCP